MLCQWNLKSYMAVAGMAVSMMAGSVAMAQPANDLCSGAIALTPGTPAMENNFTATSTDDGVNSTCQTNVKNGIWYSLSTGSGGGGPWQVSTCTGTTTSHDTVLTVFAAGVDCSGINSAANILLCNDDGGPWCTGSNNSSMTVTLAASSTYLIRVQSWGGTTSQAITLLAQQLVPIGICCNNTTGACAAIVSGACATGSTLGSGTTCGASSCPAIATCCDNTTGACSTIFGGACATGTTQTGTGTTCNPNPCPPSQACCSGTSCTIVLQSVGCGSGVSQGAGSTCSPNPCLAADECATTNLVAALGSQSSSNVGASTSFNITPGSLCPGIIASGTGGNNDVFWVFTAPATTNYTLNTCAANSFDTVLSVHSACPATSANVLACNDDSSSTGNTPCAEGNLLSRIQTVALTAGQVYYIRVASYLTTTFGNYTLTIAYVDPSSVGSCCVGASCALTDAGNCGGTFAAGGSCTPSPCAAPGGVCCRGATCTTTITSGAACTSSLIGSPMAGAAFPTGAGCNSGAISNAPCCYADYNKVGGITINDIFDFLSDWFAGSPYANVGGDGSSGVLNVQNIFDFLNNWFAGGC